MESTKALSRCMQLCSKAEYCIYDIEQKLIKWEVFGEEQSQIVQRLIDEKFIDESRFVRAFVKDKFHFNHWGKTKITYMLSQKGISGSLVEEVLEAINEEQYLELIKETMQKKIKGIKANSEYEKKAKLVRFMASRGFESELIYKIYDKL